jgi:acetyl esterase
MITQYPTAVMALHPQCKAFLDQLAAMGGPPLHQLTPAEARARMGPPEASGPDTPIFRVEDRRIPGPAGTLAVRVYTPRPGDALPGLVYFHGGGFVLGGLDMNDRPCRMLANQAGCVVVSVDYRLAPEHPYPAAVDDAYGATMFVAGHAPEFGIDPARLGVAGDSAGGNLATVTAIRARDLGGPSLAFQLLVYPQVDFNDDSPSMREFGAGHFLDRDGIAWLLGHYCPRAEDRRRPDASPLSADLRGLPPAFVITAECDPLRDQGEEYVRRLREAGVTVEHRRYGGMIHPFFSLAGIVDEGRTAIADAAAAAARAL